MYWIPLGVTSTPTPRSVDFFSVSLLCKSGSLREPLSIRHVLPLCSYLGTSSNVVESCRISKRCHKRCLACCLHAFRGRTKRGPAWGSWSSDSADSVYVDSVRYHSNIHSTKNDLLRTLQRTYLPAPAFTASSEEPPLSCRIDDVYSSCNLVTLSFGCGRTE